MFAMDLVTRQLDDHLQAIAALRAHSETIHRLGALLVERLQAGRKILLCGNGGSAADAQHIAAELVCRFEANRRGLPALALTTDTSALTAIGNDLGFERLFARQVEALGRSGDVLVGISTSGNSGNVIQAVHTARDMGLISIGLLGGQGGALATLVDHALVVPSPRTARIQECHILIGHIWCSQVDAAFAQG